MTATATPTPIIRLDHVAVPPSERLDAHFPVGSDERYEWTLQWARENAEYRRAAKLRAEEDARIAARQAAYDAANAEARARMTEALGDYVFGDDFR